MAAPAGWIVAPAKVNLTLEILGRRADGYHELESLVVFAGYGDRLRADPQEQLSLAVSGPFAGTLDVPEKDNLVLRAARALAHACGTPAGARITLEKNLPVAAGLGGGSADAAAALRALRRLWQVELPDGELLGIAATLGADVPVCFQGRPALMRGIGELLDPAPSLPEAWLVLVNAGEPLSTAQVFAARQGPYARSSPWWSEGPGDVTELAARLSAKSNDLEEAASRVWPGLRHVLKALDETPQCRLARMSGSGATCFGLYDDRKAAEAAASRLAAARPGWWIRAAPLLERGTSPAGG